MWKGEDRGNRRTLYWNNPPLIRRGPQGRTENRKEIEKFNKKNYLIS